MNTLPTEIILAILEDAGLTKQDYINFSYVSHRCHTIAAVKVYKHIHIQHIREIDAYPCYVKYRDHVRDLALQCTSKTWTIPETLRTINSFPNLTYLDYHTGFSDKTCTWTTFLTTISTVLSTQPNLTSLHLCRNITCNKIKAEDVDISLPSILANSNHATNPIARLKDLSISLISNHWYIRRCDHEHHLDACRHSHTNNLVAIILQILRESAKTVTTLKIKASNIFLPKYQKDEEKNVHHQNLGVVPLAMHNLTRLELCKMGDEFSWGSLLRLLDAKSLAHVKILTFPWETNLDFISHIPSFPSLHQINLPSASFRFLNLNLPARLHNDDYTTATTIASRIPTLTAFVWKATEPEECDIYRWFIRHPVIINNSDGSSSSNSSSNMYESISISKPWTRKLGTWMDKNYPGEEYMVEL